MSRVLAPFAWMALGAGLVLLVGKMTADVAIAKADLWEVAADTALADRDRALARADSAALLLVRVQAAHADSLARWERSREEASARAQRAAAQASEAREALALTLDSAQSATFARYEAARDSVDAASETRTLTLESENRALRVEVGLLTAETAALRESLGSLGVAYTMQRAANEGLRRALAGERRKSSVVTIVAGGVLAKLAYDALAGG